MSSTLDKQKQEYGLWSRCLVEEANKEKQTLYEIIRWLPSEWSNVLGVNNYVLYRNTFFFESNRFIVEQIILRPVEMEKPKSQPRIVVPNSRLCTNLHGSQRNLGQSYRSSPTTLVVSSFCTNWVSSWWIHVSAEIGELYGG